MHCIAGVFEAVNTNAFYQLITLMVFITSFCDLMITYYNYAFLKIHTKKPNFFCKYKREQSCERGFRKWAYVFYINVGRAFYKPPKRKNL